MAQAPTCGRPELRRGVDAAAEAGDGVAAAVGASADHLHLIELCAALANAHLSRARSAARSLIFCRGSAARQARRLSAATNGDDRVAYSAGGGVPVLRRRSALCCGR
jgi:hypothetical protein